IALSSIARDWEPLGAAAASFLADTFAPTRTALMSMIGRTVARASLKGNDAQATCFFVPALEISSPRNDPNASCNTCPIEATPLVSESCQEAHAHPARGR